jgi:hypothetical protein
VRTTLVDRSRLLLPLPPLLELALLLLLLRLRLSFADVS